jgi:hypothetical protein
VSELALNTWHSTRFLFEICAFDFGYDKHGVGGRYPRYESNYKVPHLIWQPHISFCEDFQSRSTRKAPTQTLTIFHGASQPPAVPPFIPLAQWVQPLMMNTGVLMALPSMFVRRWIDPGRCMPAYRRVSHHVSRKHSGQQIWCLESDGATVDSALFVRMMYE